MRSELKRKTQKIRTYLVDVIESQTYVTMSHDLELSVVAKVMYLQYGDVNPGDEKKVERYERKLDEWQRDVVSKVGTVPGSRQQSKEEMSEEIYALENNFNGFWCQGDQCLSKRSHWVLHASKTTCWDCMHNPCACRLPLVWDDDELAYYRFFCLLTGKQRRMSG